MAKKNKGKSQKRLARLEKRAQAAVERAQAAIAEFVAELENRVMIAELMGQDSESPEVNLLTEAAIAIHPKTVNVSPPRQKPAAAPRRKPTTAGPTQAKRAPRKTPPVR